MNVVAYSYLALYVLITLNGHAVRSDDVGSGYDKLSITFRGRLRILSEIFSAELTNEKSGAFLSLKDVFEETINRAVAERLAKLSATYEEVSSKVMRFSNGSVVVTFQLTVSKTTMQSDDLTAILKGITASKRLGSFSVEPIEDIDECATERTECGEFANCKNFFGGYRCFCSEEYLDKFGDGTFCEMPVSVECGPRRIKVSVLENYIESTLALSRTELRLRNIKCVATFNVTARAYEFFFDMSSCGSRVKSNNTHVTYSNVLSNSPDTDSGIVTGANLAIPFSCSYPKNLNASFRFQGEVPSINIFVPPAEGFFKIDFDLYEDSTFKSIETARRFKTTDTLYLQAALSTRDRSLIVIFDECWASPSQSFDDTTRYNIISNGCPSEQLPGGAVDILRNGKTKSARLSVKVFTFIDESTTYIHCNLDVCSKSDHQCKPECPAKRKRRVISDIPVALSRFRRQSPVDKHEKIIGPLYRISPDALGSLDTSFWVVAIALIVVTLILMGLLAYVITRLRSSGSPVIGLKMRPLDDSPVYY